MADKLQELTDRIFQDGVGKAQQEADKILAEATQKANDKIKQAEEEALRIQNEARKSAEEIRSNVTSELQLAAKQAISALKQTVADMIVARVIDGASENLWSDKDFLRKMVETSISNWNPHSEADLMVGFPKSMEAEMEQFLANAANSVLKKGVKIGYHENLESGFTIGPADNSFKVSFTEEDFANFFKHYLRPRAIRILYGE